jgi:vacuolar protein sorting-associated protein 41
VFCKNPNDSRDFHTRQVSLYADYEPEKLMGFLRKAGNYNLQDALAICDKRQLYRETVFLYGSLLFDETYADDMSLMSIV